MDLLVDLMDAGVLTEDVAEVLVNEVRQKWKKVLFVGPQGTPRGELMLALAEGAPDEKNLIMLQTHEANMMGILTDKDTFWAAAELTDDEADEPDFERAFNALEERFGEYSLNSFDYVVWLNQEGLESRVVDVFAVTPLDED